MLSIDEAIAHAREVAEEQRELFRLCPYPSQECNGADICKCLKNKHDGCLKCAEEHEQLAEWLEELKAYKAIGTVEEYKNAIDGRTEEYDEEYNEDIIYEMNCPKCNYDMFEIYDKVCKGGKSKYCKITNIHNSSSGVFYGTDWDVECTCPRCKTKFTFSDEDYETFGLKFNDGLSVKE